MELLIVLAFLAVLLCSSAKNGAVGFVSKVNRRGYESWVDSVTDREYEDRLLRVFDKKDVREEDGELIKRLEAIQAENPVCIYGGYAPFYSAKEWAVPIMLAVDGKLPFYQLEKREFRIKPQDKDQIRLYKWIESEVRSHGVNVTLFSVGVCGCNPRRVDDIDNITSELMMWRNTDSKGNPVPAI